MLTITAEASNAIRGVLASSDAPDGAVLRISPKPGEANLILEIVEAPQADDQVVEAEGVEVCVEPTAAEALDDKELDATVVEGQVNFTIGDRDGPAQ